MINKYLHFDYTASKKFCESLELVWMGDSYLTTMDREAWEEGFSQTQVDVAMRHALLHVRTLFTPTLYSWRQRLMLAFYFLVGWVPR